MNYYQQSPYIQQPKNDKNDMLIGFCVVIVILFLYYNSQTKKDKVNDTTSNTTKTTPATTSTPAHTTAPATAPATAPTTAPATAPIPIPAPTITNKIVNKILKILKWNPSKTNTLGGNNNPNGYLGDIRICPEGKWVTNVGGKAGYVLYNINMKCSDNTNLNTMGGDGGDSWNEDCGPDGIIGFDINSDEMIDKIRPICANGTTKIFHGGPEGIPTTMKCPNNGVVVGFGGKYNDTVSQLYFMCNEAPKLVDDI